MQHMGKYELSNESWIALKIKYIQIMSLIADTVYWKFKSCIMQGWRNTIGYVRVICASRQHTSIIFIE